MSLVRRMLVTLSAMAIVAAIAPASQAGTARVVGGVPIPITSAPWQVVFDIQNRTLCGGSFITDSWIITAAHCMAGMGPADVEAYAGVSDTDHVTQGNVLTVDQVVVHPNWNQRNYANDIALVHLATPIVAGADRRPLSLPLSVDPASWPAAGTAATVTGWGATVAGGSASNELHSANVQILASPTTASCGEYGSSYSPGMHICAGIPGGGVDSCQGDSGGPLTVDVNGVITLAGVVSSGNGCADPRFPGLYARTTSFLPWLRTIVPLPSALPLPATGVAARALAGGKAVLSWTASGNAGATDLHYSAVASPQDQSCATDQPGCIVTGLTPGTAYSFTVTASNDLGSTAAQATAPVTAVNGTGKVGSTVKNARIRSWTKAATGAIRSSTPRRCVPTASGVRLLKAGLCIVRIGTVKAYIQAG